MLGILSVILRDFDGRRRDAQQYVGPNYAVNHDISWHAWTGDKDAGGGRRAVRRVLAAAARIHARHRLQPGADRLQDHGTETLLHCALLLRPLARHVQQLRQPNYLRLSQRLF